jgi:hypothetical protein
LFSPKATLDEVKTAAENAIIDVYDGSEWTFLNEDDEQDVPDDGTPAQWYGYKALSEKWVMSKGSGC